MSMFIERFSKDWVIHGDGADTEASFDIAGWPFNLDLSSAAKFEMGAFEVIPAGADTLVGVFTAGASTDRITLNNHGLAAGDQVRFALGTEPSNALPAPLTVGTYYFVVNPRSADFQVALTSGGLFIDLTNNGVGGTNQVYKRAAEGEILIPIECVSQGGGFTTIRFAAPIASGQTKTVRLRAKVFL